MRFAVLLVGCGFQALPNASLDLAGADAPAADLSPALAPDLTAPPQSGPGPLGALPAGFCCNSDEECRSRACISQSVGPKYCSELCDADPVCSVWNSSFHCDPGTGVCAPIAVPYNCRPANEYAYGTKPLGACCASGFSMSGQECLGGLCESTGNPANPFYCTQGCDGKTPCPGGYSCVVAFCWITQTVGNDSYLYSCQ
jgi:hypothetical protein